MYLGPHQSSSGKRLASRRLTIMRMLDDQPAGAPMGVCDQSSARIRSPISPPPRRKSNPAACVAPRVGATRSVMVDGPVGERFVTRNSGRLLHPEGSVGVLVCKAPIPSVYLDRFSAASFGR